MSGDDEDEALTWAGGRDPSHYETPEAKAPKPGRTPAAASATSAATGTVAGLSADAGEEDDAPPSMSSVVLISLGVLGGIYALYTVGWFVSWQRLFYTDSDVLSFTAFRVQQVLSILAPPLWFVVTLLLTRDRKPVARLLWLVAGALVLIPWSFTFGQ